jgi:hypothetical protein
MLFLTWLRRGVVVVAAAAAAVVIVGCVLLVFIVIDGKREDARRYDPDDANYRYVTSRLGTTIDFGEFNAGDWQFLCVIGAYNDPVKILQEEAVKRNVEITSIDPVKTIFMGIAPIEETEGAISFIDRSGRGRTVLIDGFERITQQHGNVCFGRDHQQIELPRKEWTPGRSAG